MRPLILLTVFLFALLLPGCGKSHDMAGDTGLQEALNCAAEEILKGGDVKALLEGLMIDYSDIYPDNEIYSALQARIDEELAAFSNEVDAFDSRIEMALIGCVELLAQVEGAADLSSVNALIDRYDQYEAELAEIKHRFEQAQDINIVSLRELYRDMAKGLECLVEELAEITGSL